MPVRRMRPPLYGRPFSAVRDYRSVFPALADLKASQIVPQLAIRGMEDPARWQDFPRDKKLGAGVVDVKASKAETATEVASGSGCSVLHIPASRLWLNPDCGSRRHSPRL